MLHSLSARRAEKAESLNTRVMALQREVTNAEEKLKRLYRLVEDGLTDLICFDFSAVLTMEGGI
jgi:site-specific DNA recombinase